VSDERELPKSWAVAKVSEIAESIQSGFPHGQYNTTGIGLPHLRPMNINGHGQLALEEVKYVDVKNPPLLQGGDVLFNNTNSPVWVGKTTLIPSGYHFTFSNHMTRVRFASGIGIPQFFAYQLQYLQQAGYFLARCTNHVNQASISAGYLGKNVDLLVAPLAEQRRIVAAIEEQFTRLDAGVAALKSARARLKQYRAAVLKAAVEGELTKAWREAHPDIEPASELLARILAERRLQWEAEQRAKGKDPAKERYQEPVPAIITTLFPRTWCAATVEQVSQIVRYGSSAKTSADASGIAVLRMGNIQLGALDLTNLKYLPTDHTEFPDLLLLPGDLLFNRTNSPELVGKSAVYRGTPQPCSYASYLINVRLLEGCSPEYLAYFLNSSYGREWVASVVVQQVGQANVNGTKLQALTFSFPPELEQRQIVEEVERRLSILGALEETVTAGLQRAERLRQSILTEAFAGRLVPQDEKDEPASVLLARIQAESTVPGITLPRRRTKAKPAQLPLSANN